MKCGSGSSRNVARWFPESVFFLLEVVSTMRNRITLGASLAVALLVSSAIADGTLKSGPQVGSSDIPAFNPLHVNGPTPGGKQCLV
jgi:hypothetical protein